MRSRAPLAELTMAARPPTSALEGVRVVGAYRAIGAEASAEPLVRRLLALGAELALPRAPRPLRSGPITFHFWRPGDPLEMSAFGILEPLAAAGAVDPDLLLVPLLAFDRRGARLGYGAGCFDRTLAELRARRTVFALGLAFAAQEVGSVPCEAHDQTLDAVVTEREWIPSGALKRPQGRGT